MYSTPIDAKKPPSPPTDAPYATVQEVQDFDDRLKVNPDSIEAVNSTINESALSSTPSSEEALKTNSLERKTSRVTEMLISEILASRNKSDENSVIDKGKPDDPESPEIRKDMNNHEMLIYELQTMRSQSNVPEGFFEEITTESGTGVPEMCSEECPPSPGSSVDSNYADPYACVIDDNLKSR